MERVAELKIHEPALVLVLRYEAEPLLLAPDDPAERDRIVDWLVHAYPELAAAVEALGRRSIARSERD